MDQREQSEFNMAVSYLNRLNQLFYICDEASMKLDANSWTYSLRALFRELSTEMNDSEVKKIKGEFAKISSDLLNYNKEIIKGKNEIKPKLYEALEDIELSIRKILKESGLQQKMKKDAGNALEDFS